MSIQEEEALGNSVRERLGELMQDLDNFVQIERRCTDDVSWAKAATHMLRYARRDIMNMIADSGFDKRIRHRDSDSG